MHLIKRALFKHFHAAGQTDELTKRWDVFE